ncbi:MAG: heavy metal-associated domain-containing protein [Patescibacteria group bacterium]
MSITTVSIPGMHCASCAALIKDVSGDFPSIKSINVDVDTKHVTLEHDESFDMQKWTEEIESLGDTYKVSSNS